MPPKRVRKVLIDNVIGPSGVTASISPMPKLEPIHVPAVVRDVSMAKYCSLCGAEFTIERSNSVRYGECFYACCNHRNVFAGWVADDVTPRARTSHSSIKQPYQTSRVVPNIQTQQTLGKRECKVCGRDCDLKVSKSQKNPGRSYFYCSSHPTVFNGFVNE